MKITIDTTNLNMSDQADELNKELDRLLAKLTSATVNGLHVNNIIGRETTRNALHILTDCVSSSGDRDVRDL